MGLKLNTPQPVAVKTTEAITAFQVGVPHDADENGDVKMGRAGIAIAAHITHYDEAGQPIGYDKLVIPINQIPQAVRDGLKQLYAWLETKAQNAGYMGDGTTEPLEP